MTKECSAEAKLITVGWTMDDVVIKATLWECLMTLQLAMLPRFFPAALHLRNGQHLRQYALRL